MTNHPAFTFRDTEEQRSPCNLELLAAKPAAANSHDYMMTQTHDCSQEEFSFFFLFFFYFLLAVRVERYACHVSSVCLALLIHSSFKERLMFSADFSKSVSSNAF